MQNKTPVLAAIAVASFLAGSMVPAAVTQQEPAPIYVVNFMKAPTSKVRDYVRLERELWKPIHQERVRTGQMRSWALYAVQYPFGAGHEYDYVTIDTYASLTDADHPLADILRKVHPDLTADQIESRTESARTLVTGEVWRRLDQVP